MQMTLTNFEGFVEAKIVERGYDYYRRGRIAKVEQVDEGEFSAIAFGSDDYEVYVKLDGERIVEYECDCPYDWGNTCKHAVAVFYQIRYGNFTGNSSDKFNSILKEIPNKDLRKFVINLLKRDRNFRRKFLREFDENFEDDEDDEFEEDYY
ncbi:MAG: SWIM zinc finger family protein [Acidobacteria bacterium]|nr:SWIM zinc finger family protein [Acidobacteriota bacterium]